MMRDRYPYPMNRGVESTKTTEIVAAGPDREWNELLAAHPWLEVLEPFYVDWQHIWLM